MLSPEARTVLIRREGSSDAAVWVVRSGAVLEFGPYLESGRVYLPDKLRWRLSFPAFGG